MQISRLFEIVYILLNRRHTTARELAARFEVSVRTIYRDIDALSQAGVPVYATQGAKGGIFISDAYVLNKSALTDSEQNQILLALQSLSVTGHTESNQLLSRLASLFNKNSADWIEVDFSRWGNGGCDRHTLAQIKEGILNQRQLMFTYFNGHGTRTQRTVAPVRLVYKSRSWYVQAYCYLRDDYRTFKLVRMIDTTLLNASFDRSTLPPPPAVESSPADTKDAPVAPCCPPILLRFQPSIAWRVLDEFDTSLIEWTPDGCMIVKACFALDDWLCGYILSFGEAVEVLAPPVLRARICTTLQKMLLRHQ